MRKAVSSFKFQVWSCAIAALMCCALLTVAGCKDSDITKAAKAADDISAALGGLETVNEQIYSTKLIDAQETVAVSNAISAATLANDQFVANVRSLKTIDSSNKAQIVAWFGTLAQSLSQLSSQVSFGVKNPNARAQLQSSFQIAQAAADVIAQMLSYTPPPAPAAVKQSAISKPVIYRRTLELHQIPDWGSRKIDYAGLRREDETPLAAGFDAAALGALIALALQVFGVGSKVVETIRAESGLTDAQILDAAEKNDVSTRAQLTAHIEQVNKDSQGASSRPPAAG